VLANIDRTALRVRVGLGMFVVSWLPIAQLVIFLLGLHATKALTVRASIWAGQFVVGLAGLVIAGSAAAGVIRHSGWRRTPRLLWQMLRTGHAVEDPTSTDPRQSPKD
jgi:hypothetical protein